MRDIHRELHFAGAKWEVPFEDKLSTPLKQECGKTSPLGLSIKNIPQNINFVVCF